MESLHGVLEAAAALIAFDTLEPVRKSDDVIAELIEGLRLLARGDVDLARGLAHRPIAFGLAALGRIKPAGDVAQLLLDPARGIAGLGLAAADAVQHLFGVAAAGGGGFGGAEFAAAPVGTVAHGVLARVGKAAQNAAREPFPDGQALPACSGPCGLPRFRGYAGHVPRKIRSHFDSQYDAPPTESIGANI